MDINKISEINKRITIILDDVRALESLINSNNRETDKYNNELNQLSNDIRSIGDKIRKTQSSGKCYACHQSLVDDIMITELTEKEIALTTEFDSKFSQYNTLIKNLEESNTKSTEKIAKSNSDITALRNVVKSLSDKKYKIDSLIKEKNSLQIIDHTDTIKVLEDRMTEMTQKVSTLSELSLLNARKSEIYAWMNKYLFKRNSLLYSRMIESASSIVQLEVMNITRDSSFKVKVNNNFTIEARFDGSKFIEYDSLSNGQKRVS